MKIQNVLQAHPGYLAYQNDSNSYPEDFTTALQKILIFEGRINNNIHDSGNKGGNVTNYGITQPVYDNWRLENKWSKRSTKELTQSEVKKIYYDKYWKISKSNLLPKPLNLLHFDTAVNSGPNRSIKILQKALGVKADGIFGIKTKAALLKSDKKILLSDYTALREDFYREIATKGNNIIFLKGWLNRVAELKKHY